jgi:two-component system response regulator FixJ
MTQPARVYIVDDDLHVLTAFKRLLETSGYDVVTSLSPTEFLDRHDHTRPGCVLLDIGMSELNGLETQQRMLELGVVRPIIFVTGFDDARTSVEAMKSGAYDSSNPFRKMFCSTRSMPQSWPTWRHSGNARTSQNCRGNGEA